jgi:hypothetical protein
MVEKISQERWQQAQEGEVFHYDFQNEENYKNSSHIILKEYFQIDPEKDLVNKKVLESGGGCYPSVYFCSGLKKAVNVEPLYDRFPDFIKNKMTDKKIEVVVSGFENYSTRTKFDEVWFFNVLTHVIDPALQLQIAKKVAKTIRVFEPINTIINTEHPHSLTPEFFKDLFPDAEIKTYTGGSRHGFHQADCVYFTYNF